MNAPSRTLLDATIAGALATLAVAIILPSFYNSHFYPTAAEERAYLSVVFLGVTALVGMIRWRKHSARRTATSGLCPSCGYDLRATPDRCPECGAYVN